MRSLFTKILLWFWATLAVTVIGSSIITSLKLDLEDRQPQMMKLQLEEARHAYESGGREGLADFMRRFHSAFGGRGILTDETGRDLLTGMVRYNLIRRARRDEPYLLTFGRRVFVARFASDGQYWFFFLSPRRGLRGRIFLPQHLLWIIGAAILFCYLLAYHLTSPLRRLQKAVERFGQGDFSARAGSHRRDELGQLARTFDQMAERIQTLLGAERRLLLDISHELRSPLARLGVAVELARSGEDRDAALNRIQKEADRLNTLVGELLEVTRVEGDPKSLRLETVRFDQLVEGLTEDCSIEAEARGCSLQLKVSDPVTLDGDPELLRRAAENVIRNAIRYAPQGSPVEVSLERNGGACTLRIRDYGPGVPEEALEHLFDPFYRVESDRNRWTGGVGLGLSIASRAVVLHKGTLTARNAHPGLLIEMRLPLAVTDEQETRG